MSNDAYAPGPQGNDRPGCVMAIAKLIVALALVLLSSYPAWAQSSTPLGRWVQSQPASIRQAIGCNAPLPYPTVCWRTFASNGRVTHTVYFRQTGNGITTSVVRP